MARRLDFGAPDFEAGFAALLATGRGDGADVSAAVAEIIDRIRREGDAALCELTTRFDGFEATLDNLRVPVATRDALAGEVSAELREALDHAARRIRSYHEKQMPEDRHWTDESGVRLGWRWTALDAVGLYVPGGRAAYPSSVLMNAIPALVAGVERLVMVVPTPGGELNQMVMAAAQLCGIEEIYRVGGAQAVAALAWGTDLIAPADKIVGPGNAYVAEAKRQVFGRVGIDSVAGPSEILVVADAQNDPVWIAADLLSQAEHDPAAQSILITDDTDFADRVSAAVDRQLADSPRAGIAGAAWRDNSAVIVVPALAEVPELINRLAPEHLELAVADPEAMLPAIRHSGAIFLGRHTPEAVGDYIAGPDHVLPTSQAARYASGLSVLDFVKRTSLIGCSPQALATIGRDAARLADAEGLPSHAASIRARLKPSD